MLCVWAPQNLSSIHSLVDLALPILQHLVLDMLKLNTVTTKFDLRVTIDRTLVKEFSILGKTPSITRAIKPSLFSILVFLWSEIAGEEPLLRRLFVLEIADLGASAADVVYFGHVSPIKESSAVCNSSEFRHYCS